jgi:hypothetical protein
MVVAAKYLDLVVLRNVFAVAMVAGVGLTVLFAVAARSLTRADDAAAAGESATAQRTLAGACLLIEVVAVAVGLWAILAK